MRQITIPTGPDSRPIEVILLARLPKGAGKAFVADGLERQKKHPEYVFEYAEASAIIAKTCFAKKDPTAVYSFGVGTEDLSFHRHAGHRVITAITGEKGCVLKFSLCSPAEAAARPEAFFEKLHHVRIPGDAMFMLRFNGTTYHQFCPADRSAPGFFAVSVHTDEAGGLSGDLLKIVLADGSNMALLTELAPPAVLALLNDAGRKWRAAETTLEL